MIPDPKGAQAARLHKRKFDRLRSLKIPEDALAGSLIFNATRCGKPTCHCASGDPHPGWLLAFTKEGHQHIQRIPKDWVEEVRRRVEKARAYRQAVADIFTANSELLVLARKQQRRSKRR